ncbi:MAG: hypothetical protein ACJ8G3_09750, partial [Burkholderiaceae bacterium]
MGVSPPEDKVLRMLNWRRTKDEVSGRAFCEHVGCTYPSWIGGLLFSNPVKKRNPAADNRWPRPLSSSLFLAPAHSWVFTGLNSKVVV